MKYLSVVATFSLSFLIYSTIAARESHAAENIARYNISIDGVNKVAAPNVGAAFVVSDSQLIFAPYGQNTKDNKYLSVKTLASGGSGCRKLPNDSVEFEHSFCVKIKRVSGSFYRVSYTSKVHRKSQTNIDIGYLEFDLKLAGDNCSVEIISGWYINLNKKYYPIAYSEKSCRVF